jgi:hypothetical protein
LRSKIDVGHIMMSAFTETACKFVRA